MVWALTDLHGRQKSSTVLPTRHFSVKTPRRPQLKSRSNIRSPGGWPATAWPGAESPVQGDLNLQVVDVTASIGKRARGKALPETGISTRKERSRFPSRQPQSHAATSDIESQEHRKGVFPNEETACLHEVDPRADPCSTRRVDLRRSGCRCVLGCVRCFRLRARLGLTVASGS